MQDDNAVRSKLHVNILSQPQRQHNTTQPQHCTWVGHENCCAHPTHQPEQHQTMAADPPAEVPPTHHLW